MQDQFEKIAKNKALEAGGKQTFEMLDKAIARFSESLKYSEAGGQQIRSEITGYRKALLELYRAQIQSEVQAEQKTAVAVVQKAQQEQVTRPVERVTDLLEAKRVFKKEIADVMEQFADSYIEPDEATVLIMSAADSFADKVHKITNT
ncbi:MAG: hypothetical protein WCI39_09045 [Gallionellaceae bacterium]